MVPPTREYSHLAGRASVELTEENVSAFDAVLIATDHDAVDYKALARWSALIVDTRNAFGRRGIAGAVVKA
jgi:UDP-N-acetyl-D-glucosamine dehydrogenase